MQDKTIAPTNVTHGSQPTEETTAVAVAGDKSAREIVAMCDAQWREAEEWMAPAHEEARKHRDMYDGEQWDAADKRTLKKQNRPASVTNAISRAIDNICGRERSMRFDYKGLPVGEADVPRAQEITLGLKHISAQTNAKYTFSDAFEDAVKGPMGWLEIGLDDTDPTKEPLIVGAPDPFEMFFDRFTRKRDMDDCRYQVRRRVCDLDATKRAYVDAADELEAATLVQAQSTDGQPGRDYGARSGADGVAGPSDGGKSRPRVVVREHWYWEVEDAEFLVMPDGEVFDWDPADPATYQRLSAGGQRTAGRKRCFYLAVVCNGVLLHHQKSPYPWARFPYVPVWCKRDREGRPHGLIRVMLNPQEELNVAWSRLNSIARSRWLIAQPGALGSTTLAQATEALGKDNFALEVANPAGIQIGSDKADASMWMNMIERRSKEIDESVGNNEAAYGDKSNEKSGVAIEKRVMQQALNLGKVFDSYRWARLYAGEMLLALAQKFYTPQKWARIIEAQSLQAQEPIDLSWVRSPLVSAIAQMKFDVQIEDQAETATERQASMQAATDLAQFLPDPAKAAIAPDIIRMSDFAGKEKMAAKAEQAMMPPPPPPPMGLPPGGPMPLPPQSPIPPGVDQAPGLLLPPDGAA